MMPQENLDDSNISNMHKFATNNDSMVDPSPLKQPSWFDNLCEVSRIQAGVSRKKQSKDRVKISNLKIEKEKSENQVGHIS